MPWGIVKRGNQIIGVYSQSDAAPLRRSGFEPGLEVFTGVGQYSGWRFLSSRAPPPASRPPPSSPRQQAMSHRILVVDDHPLLRHGLKALLGSHAEYQVIDEAVDSRDAVAKAIQLQPDLILMDLSLPGTSGIDATVQIRRRLPQQRVLALSDDDSEIHIGEAMRAGCIGCLKKDCAPRR